MPILMRRGYLVPPISGETMPLDASGVCGNAIGIPAREIVASR
jgi:hypothetical protein